MGLRWLKRGTLSVRARLAAAAGHAAEVARGDPRAGALDLATGLAVPRLRLVGPRRFDGAAVPLHEDGAGQLSCADPFHDFADVTLDRAHVAGNSQDATQRAVTRSSGRSCIGQRRPDDAASSSWDAGCTGVFASRDGSITYEGTPRWVTPTDGKLEAILFGYACHATTLSFYEWSGDWPGFAQIELEKAYPGATALFTQGAAGAGCCAISISSL